MAAAAKNPIYDSNETRSAQKDCELYETADSEPVYQIATAGRETEPQLESNLKYDYAAPDDHHGQRTGFRKHGHSTVENKVDRHTSEMENTEQPSPIYHVLENNNLETN